MIHGPDPELIERMKRVIEQAVTAKGRKYHWAHEFMMLRDGYMQKVKREDYPKVPRVIRTGQSIDTIRNGLISLREQPKALGEAIDALFYEPEEGDKFSASEWTGRRTPSQQARLVLELAPSALAALDDLICDFQRRASNLPSEDSMHEAVGALKLLHTALGELLSVCEAGRGHRRALNKVRLLASSLIDWNKEVGRLTVQGIAPSASALVTTWGTVSLLEVLGRPLDGAGVATMAAGQIGGAIALKVAGSTRRRPDA